MLPVYLDTKARLILTVQLGSTLLMSYSTLDFLLASIAAFVVSIPLKSLLDFLVKYWKEQKCLGNGKRGLSMSHFNELHAKLVDCIFFQKIAKHL